MRNATGLLENGFQDALQRALASEVDRKHRCSSSVDLPEYLPQTESEIILDCLEQYRQDQEMVDAAILCMRDYHLSMHGGANAKALEGSFLSPDPNPLSADIATLIRNSGHFGAVNSAMARRPLKAFGIGITGAVAAVVGAQGGADVIFDFDTDDIVHTRTWHAFSLETNITVVGGLELSFWKDLPLTGCIFGSIVTVALLGFGVRYMRIRQRENDGTKFLHAGWSLSSIPFAAVLGTPGVGVYLGKQKARERTARATFSILNTDGDTNNITVNTESTLAVTITNTHGSGITLDTGATITLNMPSYFTSEDLAAMTATLSGWDLTYSDTSLIFTLQSGYTWNNGDSIAFDITNVESAGTVNGGDIQTGYVIMTLDSTSFKAPIKLQQELDLVWESFIASMAWTATTSTNDGFTLTGTCAGKTTCSGSESAYSQKGNDIHVVTTATDDDGNGWEFGYIFDYGTNNNGSYPQVRAVMSKVGVAQVGNNVFYGSNVTPSSVAPNNVSTASYKDTSGNTSIAITPTFNS